MQIFMPILLIEQLLIQKPILMCTHFSAQPKLNSPAFKQTTITCKGKEREREKKRKNDLTVKLPVVILLTREQCLLLPGVALPKISENSQDICKTKVLANTLHIY